MRNMMIKQIKKVKSAVTVAALLCLPLSVSHAAIGLKENAIVHDNSIKLGDLFYGLTRNEERVLGTAPRPGDEIIINARTLLRIAVALDLDWRPRDSRDHVVIRREATIIKYDQIRSDLTAALKEKGVYGNFDITIPQEFREIVLPANLPSEMEITKLKTNPTRNDFEVSIAAPSAENPVQSFHFKGYVHPVVKVPVLSENIQHGSIISPRDLHYIDIRENDFQKDTIVDTQQLIGMTARRLLVAGRPIRSHDIVAPQIIERGELVTLSLNSGSLNITTQVKALENGAKGDVIRVVNISSNQTLQAQVIRDGQVSVLEN